MGNETPKEEPPQELNNLKKKEHDEALEAFKKHLEDQDALRKCIERDIL